MLLSKIFAIALSTIFGFTNVSANEEIAEINEYTNIDQDYEYDYTCHQEEHRHHQNCYEVQKSWHNVNRHCHNQHHEQHCSKR